MHTPIGSTSELRERMASVETWFRGLGSSSVSSHRRSSGEYF